MAKIIIGNVKGKDGRGISKIIKTASTGAVDTYTITYTDNTTSTFTINNSDNILIQRQIVPSAAVESSATASQAYAAGDYVVVNGVLRKVKSAIATGNTISDSNSTATTVTGELANSVSRVGLYKGNGLQLGRLKGISAYRTIEVYMSSNWSPSDPGSNVCIRCTRLRNTDPFYGLSGAAYANGEIRMFVVTIHHKTNDDLDSIETIAQSIKNSTISKMDERPIITIIGVEKF